MGGREGTPQTDWKQHTKTVNKKNIREKGGTETNIQRLKQNKAKIRLQAKGLKQKYKDLKQNKARGGILKQNKEHQGLTQKLEVLKQNTKTLNT